MKDAPKGVYVLDDWTAFCATAFARCRQGQNCRRQTNFTDLAAFANALDRRRSDYATLNAALTFPSTAPPSPMAATTPATPSGASESAAMQADKELERMDEFPEGVNRTLDDCHALVCPFLRLLC